MSSFQENIHIAILGPVSAGKSTLLNGIFMNHFSDMKRKKTTMLPQIYQTVNSGETDSIEKIKEMNQKSNEEILKLRESNQYTHSHFKELIYRVNPIKDFIDLSLLGATYSILDMPGLNDDQSDIYYNYIKDISHKIDIYILVFDINSPLNRSDEVKILEQINSHITRNKNGYVHILINKCDDIEFDEKNNFKFIDDELQEAYDACIIAMKKYFANNLNKVTISPICTSDLYVYRGAKFNIGTIDEKLLDAIIKKESGKQQFNELNKQGIEAKRKFVKGLMTDKKSSTYSDFMKDIGYTLFQKNISNIANHYQEFITYHIEQDVDKICNNIKLKQINFDELSDNMGQINSRLKNLIQTTDNKCKVDEIISAQLKSKLNEITQQINNYIVSGINTYSANTIENAESFITKICKFYEKVKNMFKSNPLSSSEEKLKLKRIELLNNKLSESFNDDIFTELYTNKTLVLDRYVQCIANTLDNGKLKFDKLLEKVIKITSNDSNFVNVIINKFTASYKPDTTFKDFLLNLELIANSTKNNLEIMINIIFCQLQKQDVNLYQVYKNWIDLNNVNILQNSDEIKYIYFKIQNKLNLTGLYSGDFNFYKQNLNDFNNLYKLLNKLIGKKVVSDDYIIFDDNKSVKSNDNKSDKKVMKKEVIETEDEFLDATENEQLTEQEKSDGYNDSDDSDTVYRKTMRNAKVRTNRRVNKGGKIANLTK